MEECNAHLVLCGNKNENTFANTLKALSSYLNISNKKIYGLYLLKLNETKNIKMPNWYSISHELIPTLNKFEIINIENVNSYSSKLPELFQSLISKEKYPLESIYIDLTNGTKTYTEFAYLISTLLQIPNLFRVSPKSDIVYKLHYSEVPTDLLDVIIEPQLKDNELKQLVRSTYSEYIYFIKEVNEFIEWQRNFSQLKLKEDELYRDLLKAFEHYINGDYDSSIIKCGVILEGILYTLISTLKVKFNDYWDDLTKGNENIATLGNMALTLGKICTRLNYLISKNKNWFYKSPAGEALLKLENTYQFAPLLSLGLTCQSLAVIRNYSGHNNEHRAMLSSDVDARHMLNGILYVLGKIQLCTLLWREK